MKKLKFSRFLIRRMVPIMAVVIVICALSSAFCSYAVDKRIQSDVDGIYYWTLDGEWLLDNNGNKIKAEGRDGKDGADGKDGKDGITPQLKIENEYWYISYNNGATWTELGKATGEDGQDGTDGINGQDGDSMFEDVTYDDDYVYFTLTDGTVITIPRASLLDSDTPPNNEIWYTSTDNKIVSPNDINCFGATIVSNTYSNGKGIIKFNNDITKIGDNAFNKCDRLISITLPDGILEICGNAFIHCCCYFTTALSKMNSATLLNVNAESI